VARKSLIWHVYDANSGLPFAAWFSSLTFRKAAREALIASNACPESKLARTLMLMTKLAILALVSILPCTAAFSQQPAADSTISSSGTPDEKPTTDPTSLLPEPKPLANGKSTLIGGTIANLDRVRDRITLQVFGGKKLNVLFDGRTKIYRDGDPVSGYALRNGEHVYLETQLDGDKIFARSIHAVGHSLQGECHGQVVSYDPSNGEMEVRDSLSPEPVRIRVTPATTVVDDLKGTPSKLESGSLVRVQFQATNRGTPVAQQISILAGPGTTFTFVGRIIFLDVHRGLLTIADPRDNKQYEIAFDAAKLPNVQNLREGQTVTVQAIFNADSYLAQNVKVTN
jgi:hypothetical protein